MNNPPPDTPSEKDVTPAGKEKVNRLWQKPFTITFIILLVIAAGFIFYSLWSSSVISRNNNKITTMETLVDSNNSEIESLQNKINTYEYLLNGFKAETTEAYFIYAVVGLPGSTADGDASPNVVYFGEVAPGSETTRSITLVENLNVDTSISINVLGSLSSFITIEPDSSFIITAGASQDVTLKLDIPATVPLETKLTGCLFILRTPACNI
jgi:hypothetical protein